MSARLTPIGHPYKNTYTIVFKILFKLGILYAPYKLKLIKRWVAAMETYTKTPELYVIRLTFFETLSSEFISMTGYGIYVYLTPVDIEQLFTDFISLNTPIRKFARQCVKDTLRVAQEKRAHRA